MGTSDFNADSRTILTYLKAWPSTFISGREIARKVGGKRRYAEDRFWAVPVLTQMVEEGLVEADDSGHFRLKQQEKKSKDKTKRHISPQMIRILRTSGQTFEAINIDDYSDDPLAPFPKYLIDKNKPGSKSSSLPSE